MTPRRIVVTGSVAFDYLMTFPGKFLDVVVPDRMHRLSVSFLVDSMRRVRGGVAPNIAYGLALFGLKPVIMATAGVDALDYARWLAEEGVDISELHISDDLFTASFFVSTDEVQNQIATFYTGAMARAVNLSFRAFAPGTVSLAVIAPNAPEAMVKYAEECRTLHIPFVYDPSQQVARLSGDEILAGLRGAAVLIANEYEFGVIEKKTGLSEGDILASVPVLIVTRGADGSTIALRGGSPDAPDGNVTLAIPPARLRATAVDPTGVGDAFRAGLLAARQRGLPWEVAGRVGSIAAVYALETVGAQPNRYAVGDFLERYRENFGSEGVHANVGRLRASA
ncbi:MAG TPA: carbohydrate kinase family protein [Thermoanaerobaculia bacterium]|nr:carbohydrate kinase family protein [Thermoanaerobaculia bacterium]